MIVTDYQIFLPGKIQQMHNEKLKVLIADDEFRIGILIKTLIKWDELNLECLDIVNNGEEALKVICEKKPDIVITDIQMPRINGLELIARVSEKQIDVKFLIISGYKDFDYAHKAIQYGVKSYLLKPIDEIELNNTLRKVCEEFSLENMQKEKEEIYEKEISASKNIIKTNILKDLIERKKYSSREIESHFNISLAAPLFRVINIKLDYWDFKNIDKRQDKITVDKVISIVEKIFSDNISEDLVYADNFLHIFCLLNYSTEKTEYIKDLINQVLIEIEKHLLGFEMYQVTIGIGPEISDFSDILSSVKYAGKAVDSRIKRGTGRLIYSDNLSYKESLSVSDRLGDLETEYINRIRSYSCPEFEKTVDNIFEKVTLEDRVDFSWYYEMAEYLTDLFFTNIEDKNEDSVKVKEYLADVIQHCSSINKMKKLLKEHLTEYLERTYKRLEMKSTKPVREAKNYVDSHFSEKITLESISDIVELNPVYFSVLFKKETGMNFSSYLVDIRTEKAKEMLKNSNETIEAIAEKVGYRDVRYFSRLFTKTVGIKPAVFRKLYS